ncbi:MAG: Spo0E family sporulation regulatory protein-aspartic acid phosphatase [Clostridia bacterium]|nr:Spo0E family sporulation regulatory protein-aspartic acid phosphatase [Clostridia bacterium]
MERNELVKLIEKKKKELKNLVLTKQTLRDMEVYHKSLELDELVVQIMSDR